MIAPLQFREEVLGAIEVTSGIPGAFTEADLAEFELLSELAAAGIAAARDRQVADESIRIEGERFKLLVSSVQDYAIFILDRDGYVRSWNLGAERIKGYTTDEIIGQHFSIFYTEPDRQRHHPQYELEVAAREGRYEEERWRVRKDGSVFWANVIITALYDASGALIGFAKVTRDLTERKRREDLLRESELRLTYIVATAMEAIITADEAQRIVMFNAAAEELLSISAADAIGLPLERFLPESGRWIEPQTSGRRQSRRRRNLRRPGSARAVRADGSEFPVEVTMSEAVIARERFFTVVVRDISDRIAAEEARERALHEAESAREAAEEANRTKSAFMATMSHELRTPINAMLGYTELLRMGVPTEIPEEAQKHVERIRLSARHLLQLIEEMLTFARIEAGKEEVHLDDVHVDDIVNEVRAIIVPFAADKGLDFEVRVDDVPETLHTDPRKLRQILLNLLGNAVKFTDSGEIELRVFGRGQNVVFKVRDTGIGISRSGLLRMYEPFWQADLSLHRKVEGTGLGLAIVERFISLLGGSVEVETEEGEGSVFTVTIPLRQVNREDPGSGRSTP